MSNKIEVKNNPDTKVSEEFIGDNALKDVEKPVENIKTSQQILNQAVETRAAKKARIAKVVDRGFVHSRLSINLPPDTYGEWVSDDPSEILRFQSMGFELADPKDYPGASLHGKGESDITVGDVKLMVAPMEVKEIIEEVRAETFAKRHGKPTNRVKGNVIEEQDFKSNVIGLPIIDESSTQFADADAIRAALGQQGPQ